MEKCGRVIWYNVAKRGIVHDIFPSQRYFYLVLSLFVLFRPLLSEQDLVRMYGEKVLHFEIHCARASRVWSVEVSGQCIHIIACTCSEWCIQCAKHDEQKSDKKRRGEGRQMSCTIHYINWTESIKSNQHDSAVPSKAQWNNALLAAKEQREK